MSLSGTAMLRVASLPEEMVWELVGALETDPTLLYRVFDRGFLRTAVGLASPALDAALSRSQADPESLAHARRPLLRYLIRAGTRPTPFGLFATANAIAISPAPKPLRLSDDSIRACLFADASGLRREALAIAINALSATHWISSPSLYRLGGVLRFHTVDLGDGTANQVTLGETRSIATVLELAQLGVSGGALIDALAAEDPGTPRQQIGEFVGRLAQLGLLTPSTSIPVAVRTGHDDQGLGQEHELLHEPFDFEAPVVRAPAAAHSHVIAHRTQIDGAVDSRVVEAVMQAAHVLRSLRGEPKSTLEAFQRCFVERFEGRMVPLLEVVDQELGSDIFGSPLHPGGTLLGQLATGSRGGLRDELTVDAVEAPPAALALQMRLFERAWSSGEFRQSIDRRDIDALPSVAAAWPSTMAAVVRLAGRLATQVCVETVVGPSSLRMLSRFARSDAALRGLIEQEALYEAGLSPTAMHAELCFLPLGAVANTVIRPCVYPHRIVIDGFWDPRSTEDIPVRDTSLMVRDRRLRVIHAPSGREIVPHVSHTAHSRGLLWPLAHRLLALLEPHRSFETLRWDWGALAAARRLPRVSVGDVIVSRECWNLRLDSHDGPVTRDDVSRAQAELQIPNDVDLVTTAAPPFALRLEHSACLDLLCDHLERVRSAQLIERWPARDESAVRSARGAYAHDLIIPLRTAHLGAPPRPRGERVHPGTSASKPTCSTDSFIMHPWLDFSIECAPSFANALVIDTFGPLVDSMRSLDLIHRWHYVRIGNPRFHLHFRVAARRPERLSELREVTRAALSGLRRAGFVLGISEVPYEQELHRYGNDGGIVLAEEFFEFDSDRAVDTLRLLVEQNDEEAFVFAAALDCITKTSACSQGDLRAALARCDHLVRCFARVAGSRSEIARLQRRFAHICRCIARGDAPAPWQSIADLQRVHGPRVEEHARRVAALDIAGLGPAEPMASYIHMACNRVFRFNARSHESIAYELAQRHLASVCARLNAC